MNNINTSMDEKELRETALTDIPVRYFKMMNGDSVVSYVVDDAFDEEQGLILLEEPMVVTVDDTHRYTFSPWFPFSRENIHVLDSSNVFQDDEVDDDVKATYLKLILDKKEGIFPNVEPPAFIPGDGTLH
jgi:hypothetical protein